MNANKIGDEGADLLAQSSCLAGLSELHLFNCGLTDAGVITLARSPHLGQLTHLQLIGNQLSDRALDALYDSPTLQRLEKLNAGRRSSLDSQRLSSAQCKRWKARLGKGARFV